MALSTSPGSTPAATDSSFEVSTLARALGSAIRDVRVSAAALAALGLSLLPGCQSGAKAVVGDDVIKAFSTDFPTVCAPEIEAARVACTDDNLSSSGTVIGDSVDAVRECIDDNRVPLAQRLIVDGQAYQAEHANDSDGGFALTFGSVDSPPSYSLGASSDLEGMCKRPSGSSDDTGFIMKFSMAD